MSPKEMNEMARETRRLTELSQSQLEEIHVETLAAERLLAMARMQVEAFGRTAVPFPYSSP